MVAPLPVKKNVSMFSALTVWERPRIRPVITGAVIADSTAALEV
jgi:hypothetical protein